MDVLFGKSGGVQIRGSNTVITQVEIRGSSRNGLLTQSLTSTPAVIFLLISFTLMLFLTLCTPTARSFLRNGPSQISGFHNKFWFCTTSPVFTMDDSVPSSGVSTPVSGVATPLRGKVNNNNNNGKGKGGGGKPVVKKKEVRILMLHG